MWREKDIQVTVVEHLAWRGKPGVLAFHPANGGMRLKREAMTLKAMGVRAGIPDLVILFEGRCFCLELKTSEGRLSPAQRDMHKALRAAGAEVAVAHGVDAALDQLGRWGLLRGAMRGAA